MGRSRTKRVFEDDFCQPTKRTKSERMTIDRARSMVKEWEQNPGKQEWLEWKFKFPELDHLCAPRRNDETKNQAKSRNSERKRLAKTIATQLPSRREFYRGYLHLLKWGAKIITMRDALAAKPKDPQVAYELLCKSLADWDFSLNVKVIPKKVIAQEDSRKGIIPGLVELRKTHGIEFIDGLVERELEINPNISSETAKERVKRKFATEEQLALYRERDNCHRRHHHESDLVRRALNQIEQAVRQKKLRNDQQDDMLLVLLVVRTSSHCHYCGDGPEVYGTKDLSADRVRSNLGYWECFLQGLLVPCCWPCNQSKDQLTPEHFLQAMRNVVEFQDNHIAANVNVKPRKDLSTWNYFKCKAKQVNYKMVLTKEAVLKLRDLPCHHCGIKDKNGGLDRLHNKPIYDNDAVPCCWPCNKAKGYWPVQEFYAHCRKIVARAHIWLPPIGQHI